MDIKKYNTDHLEFLVQKLNAPGSPTYQLVIKYDDELIFEGYFDTEEKVEAFVKLHYETFKYRAEVIDWKLKTIKHQYVERLENIWKVDYYKYENKENKGS